MATVKKNPAPAGTAEAPRLAVAPPGEHAREWIDRDRRVISPSYTRSYGALIERGE